MQTVVYINNDEIQLVKAEYSEGFKISEQILIELQMGSIINGTILNKEEIIRKLEGYKEYLKNATLLLDSSSIIVKKLELPSFNKKQAQDILKYELGIQDVNDDYVYDANISRTKESTIVLGCAAPKTLIDSYLNLFNELGVKIARIDIATNAITKYINSQKDLNQKTFILNIMVDNNIISFLFEDGKFKLTNRNRILSSPESEEYIGEIFSKMSSLLQFNKSQKSDFVIKSSYYIGLSKANLEKLKNYTEIYEPELEIKELDIKIEKNLKGSTFYPLTGIFVDKSDINLIDSYKLAAKTENLSSKSKFQIGIVAMICIVVLGSFFYLNTTIRRLNKEIGIAQSYLNDPSIMAQVEEADRLELKNEILNRIILEIDNSVIDIESYKMITKRNIEAVFETAGNTVSVENIQLDTTKKAVGIVGKTSNELECSDFITRLYGTGLFSNIEYKGYSYAQVGEGAGYGFTISCTLEEGEI